MSDTAVQHRSPDQHSERAHAPGRAPGRFTHTAVMASRALRISSRNIDALITSLALPI
ncbi:ABC transporter permease, partial [Streptomyces sp. SID7982]|nr:ABC transporter permease [Streptomyces sp. SID7982]